MASMIMALSSNDVLGVYGTQPFRCKKDFAWFKRITIEKHTKVVMGYNTYEDIGRPLSNRLNIVISKRHYMKLYTNTFKKYNNLRIYSTPLPLRRLQFENTASIVIGGVSLYKHYENEVDTLYITRYNQVVNSKEALKYEPPLHLFNLVSSEPFEDIDLVTGLLLSGEFQVWKRKEN